MLAKTQLLRRTVVVAVDGAGDRLTTTDAAAAEQQQGPAADTTAAEAALEATRRWFTKFWAECLQNLKLDDQQQPTPRTPPKSTNAMFPMPPGGSWVSVRPSHLEAGHRLSKDRVHLFIGGHDDKREDG